MRAPILIAAPLGERIRQSMDFAQTGVGGLNTLPILMLGARAV